MNRILLGIDDTDIIGSRGTGFLSRQLAAGLETNELGQVIGITRHQLFVHPDIPYTSQNSSACLMIKSNKVEEIQKYAEEYLIENCPDGSDAGLCILPNEIHIDEIIEFGFQAKKRVLKIEDAYDIALRNGIYLKGFLGNKQGVIGALAAVGLRSSGEDGRYIWLKGVKELRELKQDVYSASELKDMLYLDEVSTLTNGQASDNERIMGSDWIRPVLKDNKIILIVEKTKNNKDYEWKVASKDFVRKHS